MSAQIQHPLLKAQAQGTFQLRQALLDHMSEEQADTAVKAVDREFAAYVEQRNGGKSFTPLFRFLPHSQSKIIVEALHSHGDAASFIGRVELYRSEGDQLLAQLPEPTKAKRSKKRKPRPDHVQRNLAFFELKEKLREVDLTKIPAPARQMFKDSIEGYEDLTRRYVGMYTFDLEVTDEGVTLVVYFRTKHYASSTVFFE